MHEVAISSSFDVFSSRSQFIPGDNILFNLTGFREKGKYISISMKFLGC
jgi:hypothetical protein